ncbi:MAG: laminin G domain-containing protein, partial [Verrucomicrobiae bacterium]|nr:laminin G domain-containing protein [Verrucomicrobiae bacterium]
YAQGIDVHGGKRSGVWGDVPFTRVLIHHNKVWESMLNCNDYGGIETWQGGPFYVFNNLSYNALGYRHWGRSTGKDAGFGHAYYLDGSFKNYHFNNIAWGKSKDTASPVVNCAAFQEIISYQNTFFNNTAYNYHAGSRRQAPQAGRNKYLGNIWQSIGKHVFRHADPAKTEAEGNAADAGPKKDHYALATNAYGRNVFHDIAELGVLEPSGRWLITFDDFKSALKKNNSMVSELGVVSQTPLLRNPAQGDFRPVEGSAAIGSGVKVFVPWALSGVVAEWNFYHPGDDPTCILDEHWYMTDYFVRRDTYHQRPMYSLKAVNIGAQDFVQGPLEDWIAGALRLCAAKKQYARLSHAEMMKPFSFNEPKLSAHEGGKPEPCAVEGESLKNPQIYTGNLLIEVYFQTTAGHAGGVLIEKMRGSGYRLAVNRAGRIVFSVKGGGASASLESKTKINDGLWHHVIVEADRQAKTLAVYVDGKKDAIGPGLDATVSLANEGDLVVGGAPEGRHLDGALEFMRLAHGTLAEAQT